MNVRRARREDVRAIAEVHVESWRATYPGIVPQEVIDSLSVERREAMWERHVPDAEQAVFVADADGRVDGFVSVGPSRFEQDVGELYAIYLRPHAQGTGAGTALMRAALEWLAGRWDEATLWVATENPRARRFYEREGWTADGERVDDSIPGASIHETRYRVSGLTRR